jgi:anti-sigma factor RsiW
MLKQSDFNCSNLEDALRDETPELMAALEMHAQTCPACQTELVLWREISAAAVTMKKEWPSPGLWPRISESLENELAQPRGWRSWIRGRSSSPAFRWQLALATIAILAVSGTTAFFMSHRYQVSAPDNQHLLTEQAVHEVESAQQNYEQSIDKLAKLAEPKLTSAATPLMMNYREKLQLLDSAIADCRSNLEKNQANAYLRQQLLGFYQEKQKTLEQILRED